MITEETEQRTEECLKTIGIDYETEYYRLQERLKEEIDEKEKYKKALLNICLKV